jgi:hypothetical protein
MKTSEGYIETMILSDIPMELRTGKMIHIQTAPGVFMQLHEDEAIRRGLIPAPPKMAEGPANKMRKQAPNKGG